MLTRRAFLAASGATGVAMVLEHGAAGAVRKAGQGRLRLAIVADTHLGKTGFEDPAEGLRRAVDEINAAGVLMTIVLGDLVDTGNEHEALYPQWMKMAGGLKQPFFAVPGNHDPPDLFRKHVSPTIDHSVALAGWRFVFLEDTRGDSHDGAVTDAQVAWLAAQAADARASGQRVILCTHVARHPNETPDMGWYVRTGAGKLAAWLEANRGTVAAILSGHHHCGLRGWSDAGGVHEVLAPSLCWNFDRDLSKAPGFSMPERRRGYVLADLAPDRLALCYKPLGAEALEPLVLPLAPA